MDGENPTAAPATTAGTEASQPTTNEAPAQAPEPAQATAPAAPTANIPADQIEAFNRFIDGNGGYEKAFAKLKSAVSAPAQPVQQPEQQPQQSAQQPVPAPAQTPQIPDGFLTGPEYLARQYFKDLASEEQYKDIASDIASGRVLNEMVDFGMEPIRDGMLNEKVIRKFLDMKAKTVTQPAVPTGTPVTNTPTVEYVNVGEKITSIDDARRVIAQNQKLNGSTHPMTQQAKDFIKQYYGKK